MAAGAKLGDCVLSFPAFLRGVVTNPTIFAVLPVARALWHHVEKDGDDCEGMMQH